MRKEQIKYLLMSIVLFCGMSNSAIAQNNNTVSKIINGVSHREVGSNLEITAADGNVYLLSKDDVTASIVVDQQRNEVKIESDATKSIVQDLESDVVVINVKGLTIIMEDQSEVAPALSAPKSSEYIYVEEFTTNNSSTENSRLFEFMLSLGAGYLLYDHDQTVLIANGQMRGLFRVNPHFWAGLALQGDIYTFPAEVGLNYTDMPKSLYMVGAMAAFDVSLWNDSSYPAILPARLTADIGYGMSPNSKGYSGVALSPGLLWHVAENDNKSKVCLSVNYKFQNLNEESCATSIMVGVGYKF